MLQWMLALRVGGIDSGRKRDAVLKRKIAHTCIMHKKSGLWPGTAGRPAPPKKSGQFLNINLDFGSI